MQNQKSVLSGDIEEIHAHAAHYDNKAEHMFSFLQVMTAATASFTHGANDISNAIGPYATVFQIWQDGTLPVKDKSEVPLWILAFGGACLVMYANFPIFVFPAQVANHELLGVFPGRGSPSHRAAVEQNN